MGEWNSGIQCIRPGPGWTNWSPAWFRLKESHSLSRQGKQVEPELQYHFANSYAQNFWTLKTQKKEDCKFVRQHSKLATSNSLTQHMSPKPWQGRPEPLLWQATPFNGNDTVCRQKSIWWTYREEPCGGEIASLAEEEEVPATPMQWAWLSFRNLLPATWLLRFEKKVLQLLLGVGMFLRLAGAPKLLTGAPNLGAPSKITHLN